MKELGFNIAFEKYAIYSRIRYLIRQKSGITYNFSIYLAKIKVDSYESLPIEKKIDFAEYFNTQCTYFLINNQKFKQSPQ